MKKTTIHVGSCPEPTEVKERLIAAGFDLDKPILACIATDYNSVTYVQGEFCMSDGTVVGISETMPTEVIEELRSQVGRHHAVSPCTEWHTEPEDPLADIRKAISEFR